MSILNYANMTQKQILDELFDLQRVEAQGRDALEREQAAGIDLRKSLTRSIGMRDQRIEQLEAALADIQDGNNSTCRDCRYNETIAASVLGSAGGSVHKHDWTDVDAFGWRTCRDCRAGLPPSIPESVPDQGNDDD